jgi:hypothetical protein
MQISSGSIEGYIVYAQFIDFRIKEGIKTTTIEKNNTMGSIFYIPS